MAFAGHVRVRQAVRMRVQAGTGLIFSESQLTVSDIMGHALDLSPCGWIRAFSDY